MTTSCSAPLSSFGRGCPACDRTAVMMRNATAGRVVTGRACEIADSSRITVSPSRSATCLPETVITAYASPCRFIAATSMSSANRVLPLRGAPATNVTSSRSSTSIMSPQLSRNGPATNRISSSEAVLKTSSWTPPSLYMDIDTLYKVFSDTATNKID